QIDQHEALVDEEEVDLPRPARRAAGARQAAPAQERIQQRRLADVRTAGDCHLGQARRRTAARGGRGAEEAGRGDLHARALRQPPGFVAGWLSPSALFTICTCRTYVSLSAPFCRESTSNGALSLLVWVNLTTVPLPSGVGSNLYSELMSASLKSMDFEVIRFSSG